MKKIILIFMLLSCASELPKKNESKPLDNNLLSSNEIMQIYSKSLSSIGSKKNFSDNIKLSKLGELWKELTWSKIKKDNNIISLSSGTIGRGMLFVLSKDHSYLSQDGPTLSARVISGFNGVLIRPYDISNEWAAVMLIHELVHLDHLITKIDISPDKNEYLAYEMEKKALDIQTDKRLTIEQAKLIKDMKLNSYIQVIWQFKNNIVEFQKRIIQMDQEISAEAPKSISELEMRLGFYAVSLSLDILDKGDFPKGEKEKKSIEAIAQVLKTVGKY